MSEGKMPAENEAIKVLSMIQHLGRNMIETGGAEPYDFEAHKEACLQMTKALSVIAKMEDIL